MKKAIWTHVLLGTLLAAALAKLWLLPLPSSFWVDEMVTAFVIHEGRDHASLRVAPQVTASIYYAIPAFAEKLFGFSEVVYRLPSTLLMAVSLTLVGLLGARLIHPHAGWFAVFATLTLNGFNYQAADARPYALGTCLAVIASYFLVRWLDSARWRDGAVFLVSAALIWPVHLIYAPLYVVFGIYAAHRLYRGKTPLSWRRASAGFGLLAIALLPVLLQALDILRQAAAHVIVERPDSRELLRAFKIGLVAGCGGGAWLLGRLFRWPIQSALSSSTLILILGWWLFYPLSLFAFSWVSGNSVFVPRYLSLVLPGVALTATLCAAVFLSPRRWILSSAILGVVTVLFIGDWEGLSPRHHNSDWREAARRISALQREGPTPVVVPSPFIEAKSPVWRAGHVLPSFLYCHLLTYPVGGTAFPFPFERSPESERYAADLLRGAIAAAGRFAIYGGDTNVKEWQEWFSERPELAGWRNERIGPFGDVEVAVFRNPATTIRSQAAEDGFVPIFNGRTLEGWEGDAAHWRVENGIILGQTSRHRFLIWRGGRPSDFELKLEYRIDGGKGGIHFRSVEAAASPGVLQGYVAAIDAAGEITGQIREEPGRGILALRGQLTRTDGAGSRHVSGSLGGAWDAILRPGEWNELRIIAKANTITQIINGQVASILIDEDEVRRPAGGFIGLRLDSGAPGKIEVRNIFLKTVAGFGVRGRHDEHAPTRYNRRDGTNYSPFSSGGPRDSRGADRLQ